MKKTIAFLGILALGFASRGATAEAKAGGGAQLVSVSDMKWSEAPGMAGVQMAVVDGDPAKGASHFFVKFTSGFAAPVHHHTSDHFVTVVAGTLVLTVDGKETMLPAGSFFTFSGKKPHATRCDKGANCVLSVDARGAWDVVPEAEAPQAKK